MKTSTAKAIVYIRKSTDDKKHQVLSLPAQNSSLRPLAKQADKFVCDIIEESQTAKLPGRPLFNQMLDRIEQGDASCIIVWDIDRLYRNPIDEGRVRWLLQQGIISSILTPKREYFPADAGLLMAVEGGRAVDHLLTWSRNLQRTYDEKLRNGQWPGPRCFGYLFDNRIKNIVPEPETSKIIRALYEEFAKGRLGLESGAHWLKARGISARNGNPFSKCTMHRVLTNPLYMGVIVWQGETHEGKFTPIVPAALFQSVQKVIKVKSKPRKVRNGHNFPFCGVFHCSCGAMITAQWARGKCGGMYRYYRCSRKANRPCQEPYVREESVMNQCLERLRPFALSPSEAAELRSVIETEAERDREALMTGIQKADELLQPLDEKLRKLTRCLIDGIIDEDSYKTAKEELVLEKTRLKQERQRLNKSRESSWIEPLRRLVSAAETLGKTQPEKRLPDISGVVQKFGTNPLISGKKVSLSLSEKYDFVPSLLAPLGVFIPNTSSSRSDEKTRSKVWCPRQDLNLYDVTH